MKSFRLKLFLIGLVSILLLCVFTSIVVNSRDEDLLPEVTKIEKEYSLTTSEQAGIDLQIKAGHLCKQDPLSSESIELLTELTTMGSYRTPNVRNTSYECFSQLIHGHLKKGYLQSIDKLRLENPDKAVEALGNYLDFMTRTAKRADNTIVQVMALSGLQSGIVLAQSWKIKKVNSVKKQMLSELRDFVKMSDHEYLRLTRDNELAYVYRNFLTEEEIANEFNRTKNLWKYFYMPNKTKNDFYKMVSCSIEDDCDVNDNHIGAGKIGIINPVGSYLINILGTRDQALTKMKSLKILVGQEYLKLKE